MNNKEVDVLIDIDFISKPLAEILNNYRKGIEQTALLKKQQYNAWQRYNELKTKNEILNKIAEDNMDEEVISDNVNNPNHYTSHPSGIECIEVTEHFSFCLGNAIKYLWRADLKYDAIEDLKKAAWYINREIEKREGNKNDNL